MPKAALIENQSDENIDYSAEVYSSQFMTEIIILGLDVKFKVMLSKDTMLKIKLSG